MEKREILSLTGLRFVAAFYVFLFHTHLRWPIATNEFMANIMHEGAVGMSLFFVLSGFVLSYTYSNRDFSFKDYLSNRLARIYPIYVVAALITLPWIGLNFGDGSFKEVLREGGKAAFLIVTNLFLIQAWFHQLFNYWNDGASWSISVEAFCYVLLPTILSKLVTLSTRQIKITVTACYVLTVLPGLSVSLFGIPSMHIYMMPILRLPEFIIGICVYLLSRNRSDSEHQVYQQLLYITIFLVYLGVVGARLPAGVGHNWLTLPVVAVLIFTLSDGKGLVSKVLSSRYFVWLGKISYSFYSFQAFVILVASRYHDSIISHFPTFKNNAIFTFVAFLILVILSSLGYYVIEEPCRKWLRQYRLRTK